MDGTVIDDVLGDADQQRAALGIGEGGERGRKRPWALVGGLEF
jgi:hypothetical protein